MSGWKMDGYYHGRILSLTMSAWSGTKERGKPALKPSGFFVIRSPLLPWDDHGLTVSRLIFLLPNARARIATMAKPRSQASGGSSTYRRSFQSVYTLHLAVNLRTLCARSSVETSPAGKGPDAILNAKSRSWSGGTGRRTGLKIPRPSLAMRVRPPPPAPAYLLHSKGLQTENLRVPYTCHERGS